MFPWWLACAPAPNVAGLAPCVGGACDAGSTCVETCVDTGCGAWCFACDDPSLRRDYVSRDPEECSTISIDCGFTRVGFGDSCGCGCEP